jgi:hypothetical protein
MRPHDRKKDGSARPRRKRIVFRGITEDASLRPDPAVPGLPGEPKRRTPFTNQPEMPMDNRQSEGPDSSDCAGAS